MNQQNSNKKITPDNPPPTGEDPKKKNRINIYWIYGILFVGIIAYNMIRGVGTEGIATDKLKFYEMVKQGDVEKIVIISNKTPSLVRVFVKPESIKNNEAFYKGLWTDEDAAKKLAIPRHLPRKWKRNYTNPIPS